MSFNVRYLTNGDITVFTLHYKGVDPPVFKIVDKLEDVPAGERHYAESAMNKGAVHCEPDLAHCFGVGMLFYPEWGYPDCGRTDIKPKNPKRCIAESCRYHAYSGEKEAGQCPHIGTPREYIPFDKRRKA